MPEQSESTKTSLANMIESVQHGLDDLEWCTDQICHQRQKTKPPDGVYGTLGMLRMVLVVSIPVAWRADRPRKTEDPLDIPDRLRFDKDADAG